jgi:hypothetical protein
LLGLWINIQKLPERFLPNAIFIQKYLSSDIIKGIIVGFSLIILNILLKVVIIKSGNNSNTSSQII